MTETGNSGDTNRKEGEIFGAKLAELVGSTRVVSVTIISVDLENNVAFVTIFEDDEPFPVPFTTTGVHNGMFKMIPNVGSIALVGRMNGNVGTPYFISFSELDRMQFARGKTSISWGITPPERDDKGDEPTDAETEDVINVTIGDVIIDAKKDEIKLTLGESSIRVIDGLIEMNDGTLDGLVIVGKLTKRLNDLQAQIDQIQSAISSHSHGYIDSRGPAATPTPSTTASTTYSKVALTQVKDDDYVNKKITQ